MTRYENVERISRADAEEVFASGDSKSVCDALVRVTFHDSDWRWVQNKCLGFAKNPDPNIRGIAATCLGHIARIHRCLDLEAVRPVLEKLMTDPQTAGQAEDAMQDIRRFL